MANLLLPDAVGPTITMSFGFVLPFDTSLLCMIRCFAGKLQSEVEMKKTAYLLFGMYFGLVLVGAVIAVIKERREPIEKRMVELSESPAVIPK